MVGLLFLSHYITKMNDDNSSIVARANSEWGYRGGGGSRNTDKKALLAKSEKILWNGGAIQKYFKFFSNILQL